jgi:hypothetical protein
VPLLQTAYNLFEFNNTDVTAQDGTGANTGIDGNIFPASVHTREINIINDDQSLRGKSSRDYFKLARNEFTGVDGVDKTNIDFFAGSKFDINVTLESAFNKFKSCPNLSHILSGYGTPILIGFKAEEAAGRRFFQTGEPIHTGNAKRGSEFDYEIRATGTDYVGKEIADIEVRANLIRPTSRSVVIVAGYFKVLVPKALLAHAGCMCRKTLDAGSKTGGADGFFKAA